MAPRIQGGRPDPSAFVFTVTLGGEMETSEIVAVGDVLGPYVWFIDGASVDTLVCWCNEVDIEGTFLGGMPAWWASLCTALTDLGASAST